MNLINFIGNNYRLLNAVNGVSLLTNLEQEFASGDSEFLIKEKP